MGSGDFETMSQVCMDFGAARAAVGAGVQSHPERADGDAAIGSRLLDRASSDAITGVRPWSPVAPRGRLLSKPCRSSGDSHRHVLDPREVVVYGLSPLDPEPPVIV
jgi:hypothetical protein